MDSQNSDRVNYSPGAEPTQNTPSFNLKDNMTSFKDVLGRWGKKIEEAKDVAVNTWKHLKTSPSMADAALGRIAHGTKVIAEGGYEKLFNRTFETVEEEILVNSFACYLSTSAGPVMGVLFVSTLKLAFCSDDPYSYQVGDITEWSYYKVVVPLHKLKSVNTSMSTINPTEKYIQIISKDDHEFWYLGFLNYNGAMECLRVALLATNVTQEIISVQCSHAPFFHLYITLIFRLHLPLGKMCISIPWENTVDPIGIKNLYKHGHKIAISGILLSPVQNGRLELVQYNSARNGKSEFSQRGAFSVVSSVNTINNGFSPFDWNMVDEQNSKENSCRKKL